MSDREICFMPVTEMAAAIKAGRLSPVEVIEAVIRRAERLNPKLNAYCTPVFDSALKQAKEAEARVMKNEKSGLLHGIPVSIKDLIFTGGIRTTAGSRQYRDFIPREDAIVVERLKKAGAIILGKTNTAEYGWAAITDNPLFGPTRNPWNLELTPGGSSGGAAASVAAGIGPLAIGTDGGGSIRIPASFCGVFGFKPSFGRVPQYPKFPGWEIFEHTGPLTRTVKDAALAMEVIAGRDDRDFSSLPGALPKYRPYLEGDLKGMKIAFSKDLGYAVVDPQVAKIIENAVRTFTELGARVEPVVPDAASPEQNFSTMVGASLAAALEDNKNRWEESLSQPLARWLNRCKDTTAAGYIKASLQNLEYWNRIRPLFEKYELLLTPTAAVLPFKLGSFGPREIAGQSVSPLGWMAFTYPFNITRQPAASLPCGWTDSGLPVGLQIVGRRFDDLTVLKASAAFERARPWADKVPPLD